MATLSSTSLAGLALLLAACGSGEPAGGERTNLIVISIDTLRADRLGCYGYERSTSPTLDALAARGVLFERAIAESSWTLPSTMSLFTGLPPSVHGVTMPRDALPEEVPTLFQVLQGRGYRTFGYTAGGFVQGKRGFDRGFEEYLDERVDLTEVLSQAERRIEGLEEGESYALFLHTYDVHCPYHPPEPYPEDFRTRPEEDWLDTTDGCGNKGDPIYNEIELSEGQVTFLSDQYDAGIRWVDDVLAGFVEFLDERGELERTVLVLTSDHGEEFMEHGQIGHQRSLYLESLQVPLIVLAPDLEARRVAAGAGLGDVMPTVLELLDIGPPPGLVGRSLVPLARGLEEPGFSRPLYSELDRHLTLRSVVQGGEHFLLDSTDPSSRWAGGPRVQLFDVDLDPREQEDLSGERGEAVLQHEAELTRHYSGLAARRAAGATVDLTPDDVRELEALGYTGVDEDG